MTKKSTDASSANPGFAAAGPINPKAPPDFAGMDRIPGSRRAVADIRIGAARRASRERISALKRLREESGSLQDWAEISREIDEETAWQGRLAGELRGEATA